MKKISKQLALILQILIITITVNSCGSERDTVSCFPENHISTVLNLNLPAYQNLQTSGGWIYVNEQGSGSRGLIIVRTNNGYKVYDRNAPHICPDTNTTLTVDNLKIRCAKDGAEWILYTGEPIHIAQVPPKTYPYSFDPASNILSVYN